LVFPTFLDIPAVAGGVSVAAGQFNVKIQLMTKENVSSDEVYD